MSREDMDTVLDEGIKLAIHLLEKRGTFFPFAVVKKRTGGIQYVQGWEEEQQPTSSEVLNTLCHHLKQAVVSGNYSTTALVSDVRLRDRSSPHDMDAIRVEIEDSDETPVICYLPYDHVEGSIEVGQVKAEPGQNKIFSR